MLLGFRTHHETTCAICGESPAHFRWTDTHGIGACWQCGCPYQLYFYEMDGDEYVKVNGEVQRIDNPPLLLVKESWVPILKRYWQETGRNCDPGAYNFPVSSHEVASREDFEEYEEWLEAHKDELPKD